MGDSLPASVWAHRGLYAALALALLFLRLLPLGSIAGAWPGPDLLVCLTFAWVLRRPDYTPVLLIAAVLLLEDLRTAQARLRQEKLAAIKQAGFCRSEPLLAKGFSAEKPAASDAAQSAFVRRGGLPQEQLRA